MAIRLHGRTIRYCPSAAAPRLFRLGCDLAVDGDGVNCRPLRWVSSPYTLSAAAIPYLAVPVIFIQKAPLPVRCGATNPARRFPSTAYPNKVRGVRPAHGSQVYPTTTKRSIHALTWGATGPKPGPRPPGKAGAYRSRCPTRVPDWRCLISTVGRGGCRRRYGASLSPSRTDLSSLLSECG